MSVDLTHWLFGRLSGSERIWSAIAPALFLLAYLAVAAVAYGVRRRGRRAAVSYTHLTLPTNREV